ncbi:MULTISPECIES: YbjQ family protein [Halolamina]|nr:MULTISPECIES: YbjQ family protein [Halolamina]NHX36546.1 YbjQ family protein [Halolamina sp. R1-12]
MQTATTDTIAGAEIAETLGTVRGNTVRARNVGRDFTQSLRNLVGGEMKAYTELLSDSREQAEERMLAEAKAKGADAVVEMRFETAEIAGTGAEMLAYGTAVQLE